jgi:hypothetical protein
MSPGNRRQPSNHLPPSPERTRQAGHKRLALLGVSIAVVLILVFLGVPGLVVVSALLTGWARLIELGILPDIRGPFRT